MNFNFTIKNDKLKAVSSPKGKTGNVNTYTCNFDIVCDIPNLIWFCVFKQGDNIYSQHITDGSCVIPYEVLSDVKPLYIGCYGTNADDGIKRVSTNFVYFDVKQGAYSEATAPETPTPDLWESLIGKTVPYIGDNGNWFIYDMKTKSYVDSSYPSCGSGGIDTPGLANKDLSNVSNTDFANKFEKTYSAGLPETVLKVDGNFSASSMNPIQNRVVTEKIKDIDDKLDKTKHKADTDLSNVSNEAFEEKFNEVFPEGTGGSGSTITVDDALSETSTNPIQNKVVTEKFNEVTTTIGNINSLLSTI